MYETIKILSSKGLDSYFELHIRGSLDKKIKNILKFKNVYYHGSYNVENLNCILEKADVGIVPSIWEEAYGLVGIELLAKGIPVIGNKRGGIIEYTIDNYTGWVNKSATAQELANIIEKIIKNPRIISELNQNILENRCRILKTMEQHFQEIKDIYCNVINCYR
jgi:glycosyltransferase involved in cell wall biosynthesis